jgi:hypothetical protein
MTIKILAVNSAAQEFEPSTAVVKDPSTGTKYLIEFHEESATLHRVQRKTPVTTRPIVPAAQQRVWEEFKMALKRLNSKERKLNLDTTLLWFGAFKKENA